ncbi:hypothetical protein CJ030_MR2G012435 [Morella rubra]|uniref:Cystatin domain-containing protein n=1 Tax=Morella rubra TaxID=262757 RepID=A0A6A1WIF0_9ROSI|nr:hypothetical protein CJ030_MR2G012435 [Morella rubra]
MAGTEIPVEDLNIEEDQRPFSYEDDDDEDRPCTDEELDFYLNEVKKSDGFDIPFTCFLGDFNMITPQDLSEEDSYKCFEDMARLAIQEYNHRFEELNADMELVKVLKGMCKLQDLVRYFITFEARDLTTGGNTKIYQAVLRSDQYDGMEVLSFRLKPPENEQGLCIEKEWLWEGHILKRFSSNLVANWNTGEPAFSSLHTSSTTSKNFRSAGGEDDWAIEGALLPPVRPLLWLATDRSEVVLGFFPVFLLVFGNFRLWFGVFIWRGPHGNPPLLAPYGGHAPLDFLRRPSIFTLQLVRLPDVPFTGRVNLTRLTLFWWLPAPSPRFVGSLRAPPFSRCWRGRSLGEVRSRCLDLLSSGD